MKRYIEMTYEEVKEARDKAYAIGSKFVKPKDKDTEISGKVIERDDITATILFDDGEKRVVELIDKDILNEEAYKNWRR
jgi:hypothetical protein